MMNTKLSALLSLALCVAHLKAVTGNRQEVGEPVAGTARQASAKLSPKIPFLLDFETLQALQSNNPKDKLAKQNVRKTAARSDSLHVKRLTLPDDHTDLLVPFVDVTQIFLCHAHSKQFPQLPCPKKLTHVILQHTSFESIEGLKTLASLHTLHLLGLADQKKDTRPDPKEFLAPLTALNGLHELCCFNTFTFNETRPEHTETMVQMIQNNQELQKFHCDGCPASEVLDALTSCSLSDLRLGHSNIDDEKLARLPLGQLEALDLYGNNLVTLDPLRYKTLRVLKLGFNAKLNDTFHQVLETLLNLAQLSLEACDLEDKQAEHLLPFASKLQHLNLDYNPKLSVAMREKLRQAFNKKVSLKRGA